MSAVELVVVPGPEAAAHAFERGWTTKQTDRPMGRGVGLALVAQAVHRLGGSVEVTNEVGAVFTVRVPVRRTPARRLDGPNGALGASDAPNAAFAPS